jgi:uncharacterized protein YjbI with pentapeptide repeats
VEGAWADLEAADMAGVDTEAADMEAADMEAADIKATRPKGRLRRRSRRRPKLGEAMPLPEMPISKRVDMAMP